MLKVFPPPRKKEFAGSRQEQSTEMSIMAEKEINKKSDAPAKEAFVQLLHNQDFIEIKITKRPADITAKDKCGVPYYFEIKSTEKEDKYFGAATLTEWEAAIADEGHYFFVVAIRRDDTWIFHKYTPQEFMQFSSIPPFKVNFNIPVGENKATETSKGRTRIQMNKKRLEEMTNLYNKFREDSR